MDTESDWRPSAARFARVGSRVTCNPAPADTDEDWIAYDPNGKCADALKALSFKAEGLPGFYTGNDNGRFVSWRKGEVNVITTPEPVFYELFLSATELARRFNLLNKRDRIALFQAVLYGVGPDNLAA